MAASTDGRTIPIWNVDSRRNATLFWAVWGKHAVGNLIRIRRPEIVGSVGGLADEAQVTLRVQGKDLAPEEISRFLGCVPTTSHRQGDERQRGLPPWRTGLWLLTVNGKSPQGPDHLFDTLLNQVSSDPAIWSDLRTRFSVTILLGMSAFQWNSGFEVSAPTKKRLSDIGVPVSFDIYADPEEHNG